ncbi:trypsin-like peptidase domain-containing protein [Candidatus Uhrbacteria bacterium]|nr:trypsin-like peptidase domain-containing protein [Candidatus Uhrbacteria bacterium]
MHPFPPSPTGHQPQSPRAWRSSARLLMGVAVIGIIVGGLAGLAGGILVTTGRIGSLRQVFLPTSDAGNVSEQPSRSTLRVEEESATIDVVRRASPAVVSIVVQKEVAVGARGNVFPFDNFFDFGFPVPRQLPDMRAPTPGRTEKQQVGGGSGFIVTSDGYILTNRHVVADARAEYIVLLSDDREFPARVLASDPLNDLAVLKIDDGTVAPLPVLDLGDSDQIQIGETVIAIGYALSEFRNTVTKGVISGVNRRVVAGDGAGSSEVIEEAIQTDAAINPGNSGGPLLNLRGQVIGLNTAVSREGQLLGFAIPINIARQAVESVIRDGRIVRPWLGVRYLVITDRLAKEQKLPVTQGALVVRGARQEDLAVVPSGPADKAGIHENDIITKVDTDAVDEEHPLARRIARHKPGDRVRLTVLRQGKERSIEVELGEFKE